MRSLSHLFIVIAAFTHAACAEPVEREQPPKPDAQSQSILSAQVSAESESLSISFTTEDEPTVWTHIYLETDGNTETGHHHWSNFEGRKGLDYLIEGSTLYKWNGQDDHRGWHWEAIAGASVTRNANGNTVMMEVPWAALELPEGSKVSLVIATMTENFQDTLDFMPREGGALTVAVPASLKKKAITPPATDARARFKKIASYACYYGKGQVKALAGRDAVIIETRNQTPESVAAIRKNGTLALGYISAGEAHHLHKGDGQGPGGHDSAYYDRNNDGKPDRNETWNSYFVKAASSSWINQFLSEAKRLREEYGVDGFFLDTVETFSLYTDNRKPMIELIRKLREQHPQAVIVINRGWEILGDLAGVVDGLMYESFTSSYDFGTKSYVRMRPSALDEGRDIAERYLKPVQDSTGLVVLALDYAKGPDDPVIQDTVDRAVTFNMIPEVSNINLDQIYPHHFVGKKNEVWLKKFLTPESMVYTTTEAVNGFPKDTRVTPSSIYPDYIVSPVLDGKSDKASLSWRDRAWASLERRDPHWIEFEMPTAQPVSQVKIVWATDSGEAFPSKHFKVEVQEAGKSEWENVWQTDTNHTKVVTASFPTKKVQKIRLWQEREGGSTARPNLMWVEQVAIAP